MLTAASFITRISVSENWGVHFCHRGFIGRGRNTADQKINLTLVSSLVSLYPMWGPSGTSHFSHKWCEFSLFDWFFIYYLKIAYRNDRAVNGWWKDRLSNRSLFRCASPEGNRVEQHRQQSMRRYGIWGALIGFVQPRFFRNVLRSHDHREWR